MGIAAVPQSALAAPGDPTISTSPALTPAFDPAIPNYVAKCGTSASVATTVTVSVTAPAGTTVSVDGGTPRTGTFSASVSRAWGQGFAITVINGASSPATYHVRCLPTEFPAFAVNHSGPTQSEYYIVSLSAGTQSTVSYVVIVDANGVPVWWYKPTLRPLFATLLPNGNMAWTTSQPPLTSVDTEVRTLAGALVTRMTSPDNPPSDLHDVELLPNGNYLLVVYPRVSGVDLSSIGGSADTCIIDAEVEEVTPEGVLVSRWFASDHLSPTEINPNIWARAATSTCDAPQDVWHLNSAQAVGGDFITSLRYTGVYRVNMSTGNIVWKLGGTATPQSLTIVNDPATVDGGIGQHDARIYADGSVSMFDNGHDGNANPAQRAPRVVRYAIDTNAATATMVEQITDPLITTPASCCGSARRLPGGNWVIGWGSDNASTEVTPAGTRVFALTNAFSYRVIPVSHGTLSAAALRAGMDAMNPNTASWRVVAAPQAGAASRFTATKALSDTNVWAAGSYAQGGVDWALLNHWNGVSWQIHPAPRAGSASRFTSIDALPGTNVWASGSYTQGGVDWPLLARWNGASWQVLAAPQAGSASRFTAVDALSATDVWAAGSYTQGGADRPLLEHWNGTSWQVLPAPNAGSASRFTSVSATSGTDVWAAGSYTQGGVDWPLLERWNGSSWQVLAAPQAGSASRFTSVSALSPTSVWAGGSFTEGGVSRPFVEHWNGTSWQVVRAPKAGTASSFTSISALSETDVWAAGSYIQGGVDWPVVEQYGPGPT